MQILCRNKRVIEGNPPISSVFTTLLQTHRPHMLFCAYVILRFALSPVK